MPVPRPPLKARRLSRPCRCRLPLLTPFLQRFFSITSRRNLGHKPQLPPLPPPESIASTSTKHVKNLPELPPLPPSESSAVSSLSPPTSLASRPQPFSRLPDPDEQELYDDLTMRFLERFRSTESSAKEVWRDYSQLISDTLAHVDFGAEHRHRLFRMLEGTPAPAGQTSKAAAMSKIVRSLATAATPEEYERLIKIYDKQNNPEKVHGLILEMRRNGIHPSLGAYNSLIAGYIRNNDLFSATAVFDKLRAGPQVWGLEHEPDATTYALLIRGHLAQDNHFAADRLFRDARARGLDLAVSIWNGIMLSSLKRGRNRAAVRLFRDMLTTDSVRPNLPTYRLCMAAYANSRNTDAAEKLLQEMLHPVAGGDRPTPPRPDYAIWRLAIRAHVAARDLCRARGTLAQMTNPDADIYETVIRLACAIGGVDAARELRVQALAAGVHLSDATRNAELEALLVADRFRDAEQVYEAAEANGVVVPAVTLAALARAALKDEHGLDFAMRMARAIVQMPAMSDNSAPDAVTNVVERLTAAGRAHDARALLSLAGKDVSATALARIYAPVIASSKWEDAVDLRQKYAKHGGQESAALAIVDNAILPVASTDHGGTRAVTRVMRFLDADASFPGRPGVSGWISLVDALLDHGHVDTLREMHAHLQGSEGSGRVGRIVLGMVLQQIERAGDISQYTAREKDENAGIWAGFGADDAERVLELVARRATLGV
ncbi:hypothetical protein HDU87_006783 [Geranomyces variabilis]|uniref:Uncharacterized protein n=1 Tax=Geranomyces variabilis TaxID=109894 RepID=A0AAD5TSQ2_9FUNG|nr:hypothetical protein HDU87_006783 [Geranomyces variabilis]